MSDRLAAVAVVAAGDQFAAAAGGHAWPGGQQFAPEERIGKVTRDARANEIIWEFFKSHPVS